MKRLLVFLFLFCCASAVWTQVSVLTVTDEDKHTTKEDFYHTFEYFI